MRKLYIQIVLFFKDWSEGDIIDFVGSCGHNPLGKYEIETQRAELRRDLREDALDEL